MFDELKKELKKDTSIRFLSDFDLYGSYDDLLEDLLGVKKVVIDAFDYKHRDLNKRFIDLCVEAGVERAFYLQHFHNDEMIKEERLTMEKYMKSYQGIEFIFISLPLTMEKLYRTISNDKPLPNKKFTVISKDDRNEILKRVLTQEKVEQEDIKIKGLFYENPLNYFTVFETLENKSMNQIKSDISLGKLQTWSDFVQEKKRS